MSAEQKTVYLQVCERIAAIRHDSDMIKRKISGSVNRSGLGWKGESARRVLAASLSVHFAQSGGDGHLQIRHPGEAETSKKVYEKRKDGKLKKKELKRGQEGVCERSDSMEPLRGRPGEGIVKEETESYVGWYTLNSRKMRKKKLEEVQEMYLSGRRFAPIFRNEETSLKQVPKEFAGTRHITREAMTFLPSHHRNNAQVKVSSNPDSEVHDLVISNHAHSTAVPVRSKPELSTNYDHAGNQCSRSEPYYPSSAPAPLPQPPTASRSCRPITPSIVQHPKFSIWPLDRSVQPLANQHRPSPALISSFSTARPSPAASRTRSRTAKQDQPHSSAKLVDEKEKKSRNTKEHQNDDNDVVFPPNHPFHGLDAQQRRTYWDTLSLYHSNLSSADPKKSSLLVKRNWKAQQSRAAFSPVGHGFCSSVAHLYGEGAAADIECAVVNSFSLETRALVQRTMGRVSEATSRAVRLVRSEGSLSTAVREDAGEERVGRKKGSASKLRDTFTCRPGASTPEVPARTVENEVQAVDVAAVPKKYGMAYLARKMRSTPGLCKRSKTEQKKVHKEDHDTREAADQQNTQHDTSAGRKSGEEQLETPKSESRKEDSTNETDQVAPQPAQLPKDIDQTPENTPSASPATPKFPSSAPVHTSTLPRAQSQSPASSLVIPRIRATSQPPQPQQRRCVSSGSLTLSDRLRTTRLEDLRLRSETAQEIRNLMLDIDRDRTQSLSSATSATMQRQSLSLANHTELPGGFTTTDRKLSSSSSHHTSSLHDTIERHFQPRRNSNINDNDDTNDPTTSRQHYQDQKPVRLQPSHSTLPRSYKAPDVHE